MKKVIVFAIIGILTSCQQDQPTVNGSENVQPQNSQENLQAKAASVNPTHQIEIPIVGMSCEMACGGSIRKELFNTDAVNRVQFDFKMARDTNVAIIKYDANQISQEKIVDLIQHINDGQFTTGKIHIDELENKESQKSASNSSVNSILLPTDFPKVDIPSFVDILRSIIIR